MNAFIRADSKPIRPDGGLVNGAPYMTGSVRPPIRSEPHPGTGDGLHGLWDDRLLSPELIGRGSELAMLQDYYAAALKGSAPIVMVEGEAGTGKTHLLRVFAAWAERQGARVLLATCYEVEAELPYGGLLRMLQVPRYGGQALLSKDGLSWDPSVAALLGIPPQVPMLIRLATMRPQAALPVHAEGGSLDTGGRQEESATLFFHPGQIREEIIQLFSALARHAPLVLILDDLHWADTATLELWNAAYRQLRGLPVLMIGGYRPEEVDQAHPLYQLNLRLSRLQQIAPVPPKGRLPSVAEGRRWELGAAHMSEGWTRRLAHIRLRPLDREAIQRLVRAVAPGREVSLEKLERWRQQGDDSLAFWTAWARQIARNKPLEATPTNLNELHRRLIDELDPVGRSILEAAAVLGLEADEDLLAFVAELPGEQTATAAPSRAALRLQAALRKLTDNGLLDYHDGKYEIANTLLARTVYEGLSDERRRELHRRAGQGLERLHANRPNAMAAVLARHYNAAGELNLALHYIMKAGAWAHRLAALKEAGELYWDALSLAVLAGDAHAQAIIHEALGDIHVQMGDHRAAQGHFHAALGGAYSASQQALIRVRMARSLSATGQYEQARLVLRQALQTLMGERSLRVQGIVWLHLAWVEELLGNKVAALFAANQARAAAIQTEDLPLKADAALALALLYWHQRDLDQARELCRLSIQIREQIRDVAGCARAWATLGMIERDDEHLSVACHSFAMSAEAYHQIGDWLSEATIRARWGETCAAAGDLAESVTQFRQAFELYRELQSMESTFELPLWTQPFFG